MPIVINIKASGINTLDNYLELSDNNAQITARNVVIDRKNIIEPRRGFAEYGTTGFGSLTSRAKQTLQYRERLLVHYAQKLAFDDNTGNFTDFSGTFTEVASGLRIKGQEANGNYYITTSEGIKKISATGADQFTNASGFIVNAGGPKAVDIQAILATSAEGFFSSESKVAYRLVWGTKDANNNLILGTPSPREVISNSVVVSLVQSFNQLLNNLDTAAQASTADLLKDTDYFDTFRLPFDANGVALQDALTSLVIKIDQDLQYAPCAMTASNSQLISSTATLSGTGIMEFSGITASDFFSADDKILIQGSTGGAEDLNNNAACAYWTVIQTAGASVFFNVTGNSFSSGPEATSTIVQSYNYEGISQPDSPTGATYSENIALKTYYNEIVNQLQSELDTVISNSAQPVGSLASDGAQVKLEFTIPKDITTSNYNNYFFQIYRTEVRTASIGLTLSDIDPGDEMALVDEENPTLANILAGFIVVIDNTPDSFRGLDLYTNPNSGDGILQANDAPPVAKDIALFKNSLFFANTRTKQNSNLTLLGTTDLTTSITTSLSNVAVSSNIATLTFGSSITGLLSSSSIVDLTGFSSSAAVLNGVWPISSVSGVSAQFAITTSNFNDSSTADFGNIQKSESITFSNLSTTSTYYFTPQRKELTEIIFSPASTLNNSGSASFFSINSAKDETQYYVWYKIGTATDPSVSGKIGIQVSAASGDATSTLCINTINAIASVHDFQSDSTSDSGSTGYIQNINYGQTTDASSGNISSFSFKVIQQGNDENPTLHYIGLSSDPTPAQKIDATAKSLIRVVSRDNSGFLNGFYLSGVDDTPGKMLFQARDLSIDPFYITVSTSGAGSDFDPTIPISGTSLSSDNEVSPNRIYFSKTDQPEAVPLLNYFDVGTKEAAILRILALRDGLFILKEDGIYRLGGTQPNTFSVFLFDSSARLLTEDSAVVLNNQIYGLSDQGVITISDSGIQIISRSIENQLNRLTNFASFKTATFGINYDLDRAYLLWSVKNPSDTIATQCFRYNFITASWTLWDMSKMCGIVSRHDNKLYLGTSDINHLEQERKALDRTDFADRDFNINIIQNALILNSLIVPTLNNINIGDALVQIQYLTLTEYNRLLNKIDLDPKVISVSANDFFSSISGGAGADLTSKMTLLLNKLDSYTSTTSFSGISSVSAMNNNSPSTIQTTFNDMSVLLNSDNNFSFTNYQASTGTTSYEILIIDINNVQKTLTLSTNIPFVVGVATIYKQISTEVLYVPQHFGNPSQLKHVRDATFLFESNNFYSATASYSTDLSPGFEHIGFPGLGNGIFGSSDFGDDYFGGGGTQTPLRTYVPQQKQRCRFINIKFEHVNAREKFAIYGISLVGEMASVDGRAYR